MSVILMTLFAFGCSSDDDPKPAQGELPPDGEVSKTVLYLIRHAEKADTTPNTNLSPAGLERANNWAVILQDVDFDAFYSTNYNRTLQTIQPTADQNGKEVTVYDYMTFSLSDVVAAHPGKNVMIVGHSNTIPPLINSFLGVNAYPEMEEDEFGHLYKITIVDGEVTHELSVHN